jgi:hypothetical protein
LPTELSKRPPRVTILSQFDTLHEDVKDEKKVKEENNFESLEIALCPKNVKGRRRMGFSFNYRSSNGST